jgi:hypothetical protein
LISCRQGTRTRSHNSRCLKRYHLRKVVRNLKLKIADYNIWFETPARGPQLTVAKKFLTSISTDYKYDINIKVHRGEYNPDPNAIKVFHAPFLEEINGRLVQNNPNFWSVWQYNSDLFLKTIFPLSPLRKKAVLQFSLAQKEWNLWMDTDEKEVDPFEYPLDGLILYYLTVINNDIMIHASGVSNEGEGYLFTGISGKGKSTLANLWEGYGAKVIHDDRLIIRQKGNGYKMYNTPVYDIDYPLEAPLSKIFVIEHGSENSMTPLKEAASVSQITANCIQHTWDTRIAGNLLASVSEMCRSIPVYKLQFRPGRGVIDYIMNKDEHSG